MSEVSQPIEEAIHGLINVSLPGVDSLKKRMAVQKAYEKLREEIVRDVALARSEAFASGERAIIVLLDQLSEYRQLSEHYKVAAKEAIDAHRSYVDSLDSLFHPLANKKQENFEAAARCRDAMRRLEELGEEKR